MKKTSIITWLAFLLCIPTSSLAQIFSINLDPAVEAAIRESINKPEGIITLQDAAQVTTLDFSGKGLANLNLPPFLFSLTTLNLQTNQLQSLIMPEGLNSLTNVALQGNPLTKLSFPIGYDLDPVDIQGFERSNVDFYIPFYIKVTEDQIELNFPQGEVQTKDAVSGEWVTDEGATSENAIPIDPNVAQKFYRVVSP